MQTISKRMLVEKRKKTILQL